MLGEDALHGFAIEHVCLVEGEILGSILAHDPLDALKRDLAGVGEVVYHDDAVAALEQLDDGVRADEAGPARYEDAGILRIEGC